MLGAGHRRRRPPGRAAGWRSPAPGRSPSCCAGRGPSAACRWPTWPSARSPGPLAPVAPRRRRACCSCSSRCWSGRPSPPPSGGAWRPAGGSPRSSLVVLVVAAVAPRGPRRRHAPRSRSCRAAASRAPARRTPASSTPFERHVDATELVDAAGRPRRVARGRDRHRRRLRGRPVGRRGRRPRPRARRADDRRHRRGRRPRRASATRAVLVDADGEVVERYDKVHRVPFGEYVPFRSLLEPLAGDALPDRDAVIGERPRPPRRARARSGASPSPISWEVFFPDRTREGVEDGGRLVLNPTNGSSFTGTIVQTQQVASSRLRAIETGRWVLQVAPTGFTAVVDDHGDVLERTAIERAARAPAGGRAPRGPDDLHAARQRPALARWRSPASPRRGWWPRTLRRRARRGAEVDRAGDVHGVEEGAVVGDEEQRCRRSPRAPPRAARWPRGRGGWWARRARGSSRPGP